MLTGALALSGCCRRSARRGRARSQRRTRCRTRRHHGGRGVDRRAATRPRSAGSAARRTPTLHRLIERGASTLNARTERELTDTLPNHTGMVTGRRIAARTGGHGVTWNDDRRRPPTVQRGRGAPGGVGVQRRSTAPVWATAVFASKSKFSLFERSWHRAIDRSTIRQRQRASGPGAARATSPTRPAPSGSCTCRRPTSPGTRTVSCHRRTSTPCAPPIGCWARSSRRSRRTTPWPGAPS